MPDHAPHPSTARITEHRPGPGRFVTTLVLEDLEGVRGVWHSRRNRKGLDAEPHHAIGRTPPRRYLPFEPERITWWVGVSFMLGAALFATGSAAMWRHLAFEAVSPWILFVGSIFFTTAAYLQVYEVVNEPDPESRIRPRAVWMRLEPAKIGWWASIVQLAGTLLFNVNTFAATRVLSRAEQEAWSWTPNAIGSMFFLIASYLAYAEVCRGWTGVQPKNISWWIVVINMLGSIAFGVSAVASFVLPDGAAWSASLANLFTCLGAVCFFAAAYLLLPEMTAHASPEP